MYLKTDSPSLVQKIFDFNKVILVLHKFMDGICRASELSTVNIDNIFSK